MADINIDADLGNTPRTLEQFAELLKANGEAITGLSDTLAKFNRDGDLVSATLQRMTQSGQKVQQTFENTQQGVRLVGTRIVESSKKAKDALLAVQEAAGAGAAGRARQLFPIPDGASIGAVLRYSNAITRFQQQVGQANLSTSQINNLFQQAAQGPAAFAASLSALPPRTRAVAQSLLQVGQIAQQTGAQLSTASQRFTLTFEGLARIAQVQLFRRVETAAINAFIGGIGAAFEYQVVLQQTANVANQTGGAFEAFRQTVRQTSEQFATPLPDTLLAAQQAYTSQLGDAARGQAVLRNAFILTEATGADLQKTTNLLTSTLQAFNRTGDQAAATTNTLFQISQRTRSSLDQLGISIGRISQNANALDLSLEQVGGLFLTISQQGGRPTEAFSLLNRVLDRLRQPTEDIQRVFEELGVTDARLGIQTFGLVGFLDQLNDAFQRTPERASGMGRELRTLRALMALTGDQADILTENIESLGTSAGPVFEAQAAVAETAAQSIRRAFTETRNSVVEDLGGQFVAVVQRTGEALGGTENAFNAFFRTVSAGTTVVGTYLLVFRGVPIATTLATASISRLTTAMFGNTAAANVNGAAVARMSTSLQVLNTAAAGAFVGFSLTFVIDQFRRAAEAAEQARLAKRLREIREETERLNATQQTQTENQIRRSGEEIAGFFRPRLQALASISQALRVQSRLFEEQSQIVLENNRIQVDSFLNGLRESAREAKQVVDRTTEDIRQSIRLVQTFPQAAQQRAFQTQLGIEEDPLAAIRQIEQRRRVLQQQVTEAFQSGQREQIEGARNTIREIDQLNQEQTRRELQVQRILFEQGRSTARVTINRLTGQRQLVFDLAAANQRNNEILQFRQRIEKELQDQLTQRLEKEKFERERQAENVAVFERLVTTARDFRIFNQEGQLLPDFRNANEGLARFDELQRSILIDARNRGISSERLIPILDAQRNYLQQQYAIQENIRINNERIQGTSSTIAVTTGVIARHEREIGRIQQEQINGSASLRSNIEIINSLVTSRSSGIANTFRDLFANRGNFEAFTRINEELQRAVAASAAFRENSNPENFRNLLTAADRLRGILQRTDLTGLSETQRTQLQAATNGIEGFVNRLRQGNTQVERLQASIENIRRNAQAVSQQGLGDLQGQIARGVAAGIQGIGTGVSQIGQEAQAAQAPLQALLVNAQAPAQDLSQTLSRIINQIQAIRANPLPNPGQAAGIPGFATGGVVNGPSGLDNVLIRATAGEFVMDVANTRKFYSQLVAMRQGIAPRNYASGGPVTNVGGVSVNLNVSGNVTDAQVRDIGRRIDREIRRGTIRFN